MKAFKNKRKSSPDAALIPGVDTAQLEALLEFMSAHGLEEFEYDYRGVHIRLKKALSGGNVAARSAPVMQTVPAPESGASSEAAMPMGAEAPASGAGATTS